MPLPAATLADIAPNVAASMFALTAAIVLSSAGGWVDYQDMIFILQRDNNAFKSTHVAAAISRSATAPE